MDKIIFALYSGNRGFFPKTTLFETAWNVAVWGGTPCDVASDREMMDSDEAIGLSGGIEAYPAPRESNDFRRTGASGHVYRSPLFEDTGTNRTPSGRPRSRPATPPRL